MPTLTEAEKRFAKTIRVPVKEKLPEKKVVRKYITEINSPGELVEKIGNKVLMKLPSGDMSWYEEASLVDISDTSETSGE